MSTPKLDLDAIRARIYDAENISAHEVESLCDEVERLRKALQEIAAYPYGTFTSDFSDKNPEIIKGMEDIATKALED